MDHLKIQIISKANPAGPTCKSTHCDISTVYLSTFLTWKINISLGRKATLIKANISSPKICICIHLICISLLFMYVSLYNALQRLSKMADAFSG